MQKLIINLYYVVRITSIVVAEIRECNAKQRKRCREGTCRRALEVVNGREEEATAESKAKEYIAGGVALGGAILHGPP